MYSRESEKEPLTLPGEVPGKREAYGRVADDPERGTSDNRSPFEFSALGDPARPVLQSCLNVNLLKVPPPLFSSSPWV
jgi:hypothetical protein